MRGPLACIYRELQRVIRSTQRNVREGAALCAAAEPSDTSTGFGLTSRRRNSLSGPAVRGFAKKKRSACLSS